MQIEDTAVAEDTASAEDTAQPVQSVGVQRTPLLETLLGSSFGIPKTLSLDIHPSDEMLRYMTEVSDGDGDKGLAAYVYSGLQAFSMTEQLVNWRFGGFESINMLDFASGYGRVTRHLLGSIDRERLTISDLMPEAVAYQEQVFEVKGIVSTVEPEQLEIPGEDSGTPEEYSVVQAISLFSHLPEDLFRRWLVKLWSHVEPGGLLIASVHDTSLLQAHESDEDFIFLQASENSDLDPETYGSTWVTPMFMERAIGEELSDSSYVRLPKGLCVYQDIYAIVKQKDADFSTLAFNLGVEGYVDNVECEPGSPLKIRGWAAAVDRDKALDGIDFMMNGEVVGSADCFGPRPDVAAHFDDERMAPTGWGISFELPSPVSFSHDVIMIVARLGNVSTILWMGCIYALLTAAAKADLKFLKASQAQSVEGS